MSKIPRIKTSYPGKALACPLRGLPGIPNLNGATLKRRRQPLGFIHNSHSGNQIRLENPRLWSLCAGGGPESGRLDEHSTEQGPYDASSRKQEPTATRRCGTDGGGLRHRQEKEDASSESNIASITTHLAGLSPPNNRPSCSIINSLIIHRLSTHGGCIGAGCTPLTYAQRVNFITFFIEWNNGYDYLF